MEVLLAIPFFKSVPFKYIRASLFYQRAFRIFLYIVVCIVYWLLSSIDFLRL